MNALGGRRLLPAAVGFLVLAGVFTPIVLQGQGAQTGPSQLSVLIGAAESSKLYSHATVDYAVSHRLAVSGAQAQLSQADSLLATAKADAQAGSNLAAGIQAAEAAMSAYTEASTEASIALGNAGLTASVDYYAAEDAIVEINATASATLSVAAQACANAGAAAQNTAAFADACSKVDTKVASAKANLSQAASLLVRANGNANATLDLSPVLSLIASARGDVMSCQPLLVTIASYSYSARARAYVASVIVPLSAQANATIKAEQSTLASLKSFQTDYTMYTAAQGTAMASVTSSASTLATGISHVDTSTVSTSISAAQTTEGQASADMTALLGLSGLLSQTSLITDIKACASTGATYWNALSTANSWSGAYSQTQLSGFANYLSMGNADEVSVQSAGTAYVSACSTVVTDLQAFLLVPGVMAIYNNLVGLQVTQTVNDANTSLQQETAAMATVQTEYSSLNSVVSSSESAIPPSSTLLNTAASVSYQGASYLNTSASAALAQVATSVQATAQAAQSFIASAQACLKTTVSAYTTSTTSLSSSGVSLSTQTQGSLSVTTKAVAYMSSSTNLRIAEAAFGQSDLSQAMQLFSRLDVPAGSVAMAQAYLQFQTASSVSA
ncbi:MAG TPA: hypothetical protein VGR53_06785 [Nitrososphaerales archaeon]|nr:hypothetical protein [Nitrososphaerales archaeon]